MDSDWCQVVLKGAGKRAVARVRKQDWLAIGRKQRPKPGSGGDLRKSGKLPLQFIAANLAKIGDNAFADMGQLGRGHCYLA